jgi:hypothetical protein
MVANLTLAPSEWEAHDNYPHNILLLGSHDSFRNISHQLVDRANHGAGIDAVVRVFRWWKAGMRSHEHYEEGKLYPYLEHRWGLSCEHLEAGHKMLAEADAAVFSAGPQQLADTVERHHQVLMEHLDLEERTVVPALLALTRDEFDDYCATSLRRLMQRVPCHSADGCRNCSAA